MNRSDQLVVDFTLATASLRFSITAEFDLARGIMHTKLAARSSPLHLLGVVKLEHCSESCESPRAANHPLPYGT